MSAEMSRQKICQLIKSLEKGDGISFKCNQSAINKSDANFYTFAVVDKITLDGNDYYKFIFVNNQGEPTMFISHLLFFSEEQGKLVVMPTFQAFEAWNDNFKVMREVYLESVKRYVNYSTGYEIERQLGDIFKLANDPSKSLRAAISLYEQEDAHSSLSSEILLFKHIHLLFSDVLSQDELALLFRIIHGHYCKTIESIGTLSSLASIFNR